MTEQEALEILDNECQDPYKVQIALKVARLALKKQIAKPLFGNKENPIHTGDTVNGLCPNCLTEFICITPRYYKENGFGYCKQCGQKLDWSEV